MKAQHLRYGAIAFALVTVGGGGAALAQETTTTTAQTESRDEGFDDWGLLGLLGLAGLLGRRKADKPDMHIDHTKARP